MSAVCDERDGILYRGAQVWRMRQGQERQSV